MEAIKDFESFYSIKIEPQLAELRKENKYADKLGILMVAGIFLTAACFIATMVGALENPGGAILTVLLLILSIVGVYKYGKKEDAYTDHFKKNVIGEIINYLQPQLIYKPEGYVAAKEYRRSSLYRKRYDYYDGDDLLQGKYKDVSFYCSEIHTYYTGGARNRNITIFKGLFFVAGANKEFDAGTYVWPRDEDQFAKSLGEQHRMLAMPKVIELHLHNAEFENIFVPVVPFQRKQGRSLPQK